MATKSEFDDKRLDKTYRRLVTEMASAGSAVINRACESAASRKAAYRFVNNKNVTVGKISKHLVNQMIANIDAIGSKEVLVAQDTMEVVRENVVGRMKKSGKTVLECARTKKGMRSHSALVMDADSGIPLGFGYLKIWGREPKPVAEVKEEDFTIDRKRQASYYVTDPKTGKKRYKYNIPISERDSESSRWVESAKKIRTDIPESVHIIMVQDREGDMYPLLTLKSDLANFDIVVRAAKQRKVLTEGSVQNIFEHTLQAEPATTYTISVSGGPRKKSRKATVQLRYGHVTIRRPHSPIYPQKTVEMNYVRVTECTQPADNTVERIDWLLLTTLDLQNLDDAMRVVGLYRNRWFIEDYHRLLKKKGFGIEDIQVESNHAFEINLALSIKIAYETALVKKGFDSQDDTLPATLVFTPLELEIVDNINRRFNPEKKIYKNPFKRGSLAWASWAVACEGGWSAMPSQPKPGIITFKRGIDRIEAIYQFLLDMPDRAICG